jgi:hypothetical protein
MKTIIIASVFLFIVTLVATYFHLVYSADIVAQAFGGNYYISTFAVPILFAVLLAFTTYFILKNRTKVKISASIWLAMSSSLGAVLPAGLLLWVLNQPH